MTSQSHTDNENEKRNKMYNKKIKQPFGISFRKVEEKGE